MIRIIQQRPDGELQIAVIRTVPLKGIAMKKRADELLPGDRIRPYRHHPSVIRTIHLCRESEAKTSGVMCLQFADDPGMPLFPSADRLFEVEA
jgi:hypothetical protein